MQQQDPSQTQSSATSKSQSQSPLSEAKPSLDEIFSKDPEKLQDIEIETIVGTLRDQRVHWLAAEAAGKTKGGAKAPKGVVAPANLALDDLGL